MVAVIALFVAAAACSALNTLLQARDLPDQPLLFWRRTTSGWSAGQWLSYTGTIGCGLLAMLLMRHRTSDALAPGVAIIVMIAPAVVITMVHNRRLSRV